MPRPQSISEEHTRLHHVVVDETCVTRHRWMVLGSIVVADEHVHHVRAKLNAMKASMGLAGEEVKWERADKGRIDRYKRLANVVISLIEQRIIRFHSITVCMDAIDLDKYAEGDPDVGYNIYLGQLLLKYLRKSAVENTYNVLLDERTSKVSLLKYQARLNWRAYERHRLDHHPFRSIAFENSKADVLLQMTDLFTGAIGHEKNRKHVPKWHKKQNPYKNELAKHMRDALKLRSFRGNTGEKNDWFTVWVIKFHDWKGRMRKRVKPKVGRKRSRKGRKGRQAAAA
jgi:hypothetical protein